MLRLVYGRLAGLESRAKREGEKGRYERELAVGEQKVDGGGGGRRGRSSALSGPAPSRLSTSKRPHPPAHPFHQTERELI